jgi:hypothetical protein
LWTLNNLQLHYVLFIYYLVTFPIRIFGTIERSRRWGESTSRQPNPIALCSSESRKQEWMFQITTTVHLLLLWFPFVSFHDTSNNSPLGSVFSASQRKQRVSHVQTFLGPMDARKRQIQVWSCVHIPSNLMFPVSPTPVTSPCAPGTSVFIIAGGKRSGVLVTDPQLGLVFLGGL